jgi:hypothetical protein
MVTALITQADIWARLQSFYGGIPVQDIDYAVHISLRHKYIFTIVPKAACSMLRLAINRFELDNQNVLPWAMDVIHARAFTPTLRPTQVGDFQSLVERPDYFKFCFVRDPHIRLLSSYLNRIAGNKAQKQAVLRGVGLADAPLETHVSFETFVSFVTSQSPAEMDPHWRPQYHQTLQGALPYDFIGRVERLHEDLEVVAGHLGRDFLACVPKKPMNVHNAAALFERYYTPELLDKVTQLYAIDFETFGYAKR